LSSADALAAQGSDPFQWLEDVEAPRSLEWVRAQIRSRCRRSRRTRDLAHHLDGFLHAELRLAVQLGAQRLAFDVRHHVIEESVGGARVEQREDVRVLEGGRGGDLLHEPLGAEGALLRG
jgi:hypothetical protein